jgi:multidrug resistance efflux pump
MNKSQQHPTTHAARLSHAAAHHATPRRRRRIKPLQRPITLSSFLRFEILGLLIVVAAGVGGFYLWHQGYYYYSTDHAFVTGTVSNIAPDRTGTLTDIYYRVGDTVQAGDKIATVHTNNGGSFDARSPINGQIVSEGSLPTILIGTGQQLGTNQVVQEGQNIAQVVDPTSIQITAIIDGSHIKDIAPGQDVDVHVPAVSSDTLHGTVNEILPVAANLAAGNPDPAYQQYPQYQGVPVQINLGSIGGYTFRPGEAASVTIHIHEDASQFQPTVVVGPTVTPSPEPSH